MMEIIDSISYWLLILFVQFTPVDTLAEGVVYRYETKNQTRYIEVQQKRKLKGKPEIREVTLVLGPDEHNEPGDESTFTVVIWYQQTKTSIVRIDDEKSTLYFGDRLPYTLYSPQVFISSDISHKYTQISEAKTVFIYRKGWFGLVKVKQPALRRVYHGPKSDEKIHITFDKQKGLLECLFSIKGGDNTQVRMKSIGDD